MRQASLLYGVVWCLLWTAAGGRPAIAAAAPAASVEAENKAGIRAMGQERYEEAIAHFRQALVLAPDDRELRYHLATAYNNHAITLAEQLRIQQALPYARSALTLFPDDQQFRANLSRLLTQQGRDDVGQGRYTQARAILQEALQLDSSNASALVALGFASYYAQQLKQARLYWRQAAVLRPDDVSLKQLLKQVDQELEVESKFTRASAYRFDIRLEPGLAQELEQPLRQWLTEARRVIGADLQYFPKQQVVVLVYRLESFRQLRQEVPEWVAGRYDGKIRLPWDTQVGEAGLRQTTWHEYTHAVVQGLTNGRCPMWLNEGLAQWEARKQLEIPLNHLQEALAQQPPSLIPFGQLSDSFPGGNQVEQVSLAYEQSLSVVQFLIERYGWPRLRRLLKHLKDGAAVDQALQQEYRLTLAGLEAAWRKQIAKTLGGPPAT